MWQDSVSRLVWILKMYPVIVQHILTSFKFFLFPQSFNMKKTDD